MDVQMQRSRRTLLLVGLTLAIASTAGCGTADEGSPGDPPSARAWQELPTPPVTPRTGATTAWTGTEALFLGGTVGDLCPPNAACISPDRTARDGAAYAPASRTWRTTATAPVELPGYGHAPVVGDQAFLLLDAGLLVYDASDDAWSRAPGPSGPAEDGWSLAQGDGVVIALRDQQRSEYHADQQYDPVQRRWEALPRDPLVPSFGREVVATPHGLLLTGHAEVDQPGSDLATSLTRAALLSGGAWRQLPDSDQLGGGFTWTGKRAVAPRLGGADGGEVNGYGRTVPYGGTLELPDGRWGTLPDPPAEMSGDYPLYAVSGPRIVTEGWLYDDDAQAWTRVPRPPDAPDRPGSTVWAGAELIVLGGYTPDEQYTDSGLSRSAYSYRP